MDINELENEILKGKNTKALQKIADSEAGRRLAGKVDVAAIERAAQEGDTQALSDILRRVMETPEGKELAKKVKKAVSQDGRGS